MSSWGSPKSRSPAFSNASLETSFDNTAEDTVENSASSTSSSLPDLSANLSASSLSETSIAKAEDIPAYSAISSLATSSNAVTENYTIVTDVEGMVQLMNKLVEVVSITSTDTTVTPSLYLDAEGNNLSRHGELSILQLHVDTAQLSHTYLIHVHVIKHLAFLTKDSNGDHTLKSLLENDSIAKVFFDVRGDSDALFGQYGVLLAGVIDLQLMEVASRRKPWNGKNVKGLKSCLKNDLDVSEEELEDIQRVKGSGKQLWNPQHGGSFDRFNDDPLTQGIIDYCVADCVYMPRLYKHYNQLMEEEVHLMAEGAWKCKGTESAEIRHKYWALRTIEESRLRVMMATKPIFTGEMDRNPWWKWYG